MITAVKPVAPSCARCGAPTGGGTGRPPMLCAGCAATHAWCSTGQHVAPRAAFQRNAARPCGVQHSCRACLASPRRAALRERVARILALHQQFPRWTLAQLAAATQAPYHVVANALSAHTSQRRRGARLRYQDRARALLARVEAEGRPAVAAALGISRGALAKRIAHARAALARPRRKETV